MLQTTDAKTQRLLDLADYLERVGPRDFDMGYWDLCICGYAGKMLGMEMPRRKSRVSDMVMYAQIQRAQGVFTDRVAAALELDEDTQHELFVLHPGRATADPRWAARVVRHLALTGQVDWRV